MTTAVLPAWMRHRQVGGLLRLGRDYDGGYVVARADIDRSDLLLSMGINEDWSFEADFLALHAVPLIAYDASVGDRTLRAALLRSLMRPDRPSQIRDRLRLLRAYRAFFSGARQHRRQFVGSASGGDFVAIDEVFSGIEADRIFLKMDIEGNEYRVLDSVVANSARLTGLVIEFHDCDLHLDRFRRFVEALDMPIVHIHANNFAPVCNRTGVPLILEVTFSRHARPEAVDKVYPCALDMPCAADRDEFILDFAATAD